ncbi:helix-turn-helix domain-containing protein [Streptomyces sp. NPDC048595]|uniref:helix-turn-helix domain-containing protein n=1 Tax=Streptomyces sp. NPDC048595 TaxID=3365576 RepID=UPI00370FAE0D
MPRWKALPEELDPQVGEFTDRLRTLVDRSGLSVAAVADRTGFSKTSWERYLNGRLLPPQRAVIALAEATGTHPGHLTTMWELAERAWSRAEMRHDVTMEAIRVAQARAALDIEAQPAGPKPPAKAAKALKAARSANGVAAAKGVQVAEPPQTAPRIPPVPHQRSSETPSASDFPEWAQAAAAPPPAPPDAPAEGAETPPARRGRLLMGVVGAVGALLVAGAAFLLLNPGTGGAEKKAAPAASKPTPSARPVLPAGVRCDGAACAGKDPEAMGCGGKRAVSPSRGMAGGALVEVRYSAVCHAAWARISGAAPGDRVTIGEADRGLTARVERGGAAYTAMVEVPGDPAKVTACGTTVAGTKGCVQPTAR